MNRARKKGTPVSELSRDMYGFLLKPQHLQRYREFASIYKEEEGERSERWEKFLRTYSNTDETITAATNDQVDKQEPDEEQTRIVLQWRELRPSLCVVEQEIATRSHGAGQVTKPSGQDGVEPVKPRKADNGGSDDESDDEFYDLDKTDSLPGDQSDTEIPVPLEKETECPWREELQFLVRGGVPMALRGELWQVFVRTKARRVEGHYELLLNRPTSNGNGRANGDSHGVEDSPTVQKYAGQIEKDLPRTFPGHPALDEDGRNALRRLLTAYARHNPDVGYCQAMNFFAALLLLMMPEENAFWTLAGIIDDYFNGYYSDKLLEAQVDQLVFEELAREYFPRLVSHLESIGVQIPWISGPWFLSIFVNVLPWESVLRVWDVLLFEGNRTMLFRTALALMELHAPALMATRDTADFISLMQNLAGATFDSSQLVLTACMGFQGINEQQLESLRTKHRPVVLATLDERASELQLWRSSQAALAKKLSRKLTALSTDTGSTDLLTATSLGSDMLDNEIIEEVDDEDLEERDNEELVLWLKSQLCLALDEKRRAVTRAEELDVALMELVKEDNRRELSAKVEMLEADLAVVKQMLSDKQEQERAMVQVMLRMEQEQKMAEDARRYAENDAAVQQQAAQIYQEKYVKAMEELEAEKKRAVMAETMLEATLQYEAGQPGNARKQEETSKWSWPLSSPKTVDAAASKTKPASVADTAKTGGEEEPRKGLFSRINWRDRTKAKVENVSQASAEAKVESASPASSEKNAAQEELKPNPAVDENQNPGSVESAGVEETS